MNWISGTGTKQLLPLIYSGQNQLQNRVDRMTPHTCYWTLTCTSKQRVEAASNGQFVYVYF